MNNAAYFKTFEIITKHAHVYLDNALEKYGLNHSYRILIEKIVDNPGISRDVIKKFTHVHPSNTTRAIDYLASEGFIVKKTNDLDKRICYLYPTDKLKLVYNDLMEAENEWMGLITKEFSEEDLNKFFDLLNKSSNLSTLAIHGDKNGN
ncbi:MAG: MarR family transcriptional regulator [Bacilli bacterium]|nr:MarR family transcriptional regulator [Bacilli bacterium]